jgi:hypothetical protein
MLEQLFNLIRSESESEIINNPAIPNELNNHAVGLATDSIFGGLQNALANGGLKSVLGMFTGGNDSPANSGFANNPLVGGMINNFVGSLMKKFGIDNSMATGIAASLIPKILGKLVNKTNDSGDSSFDINGIIGALTGGNSQGGGAVQLPGLQDNPQASGGIDFGGILKNLTSGGLDANKDGSIGLDDLSGIVGGLVGGKQQSQQSGGGVMDMLKGLIGG